MKRSVIKMFCLVFAMAFMTTSSLALAINTDSVAVNLLDTEEQVGICQWNGEQVIITVGEATKIPDKTRFQYDLTEGVGTWSRRVSITSGALNVWYTVKYTIHSNLKVSIVDLYDAGATGIGVSLSFLEYKIIRANETNSLSAECYASWEGSIGSVINQIVKLRCRFQNSVLNVTVG